MNSCSTYILPQTPADNCQLFLGRATLPGLNPLSLGGFDLSETTEPVADHADGFALIGRANVRDKTIVAEIQPEGVPTDVGANNYLPILVIQTDEGLEIARQTIRVIGRGEKFFAPTEKHRRRSIRLKGYDYNQAGAYFVTICTHDRVFLFGQIEYGEMTSSEPGHMVEQYWNEIPAHFPHVELDAFVIMPNHVHGILLITEPVGAENFSPPPRPSPQRQRPGTSKTVGSVIRGFKIGVTKWMREHTLIHNIWQRNYYEHIIRDEADLNRVREYIAANPARWDEDDENPGNIKKAPV